MAKLWTVQLQYSVVTEADSEAEAYRKVCARIKEEPGMFVSRVQPGIPSKHRSLWKRLLFG